MEQQRVMASPDGPGSREPDPQAVPSVPASIPDADPIWDAACPPCPFCDEDGFDLPGLAHHIDRYCDLARRALSEHEKDMRRWFERMDARGIEAGTGETAEQARSRSDESPVAEGHAPKTTPKGN